VPPKALNNLDGNKSYKSLHSCHEVQKTPVGTLPHAQKINKKKQVIELNINKEVNEEDNCTKSKKRRRRSKSKIAKKKTAAAMTALGTPHPT
jgi:hypothetical protein